MGILSAAQLACVIFQVGASMNKPLICMFTDAHTHTHTHTHNASRNKSWHRTIIWFNRNTFLPLLLFFLNLGAGTLLRGVLSVWAFVLAGSWYFNAFWKCYSTNALHGGHFGWLPPALTGLRNVDPLLLWSLKQSQEEISKGPLPRHMQSRIKMRHKWWHEGSTALGANSGAVLWDTRMFWLLGEK